MFKVVGIDPGLAATGIGIVTGTGRKVTHYAYGAVRTSQKHSQAQRLEKIYTFLCSLLASESPDLLIIEDIFSLEKFPRSGITLGQVAGVVMLASRKTEAEIRQIAVREAKQVLTGSGNASKIQLEKAVRALLACGQPIRPYHASDALGLALIGLFRYGDGRQ